MNSFHSIFLSTLLFSGPLSLISQENSVINQFNSKYEKTGYWIERDTTPYGLEDTIIFRRSEGQYLDGQRIGIWKSFNDRTDLLSSESNYSIDNDSMRIKKYFENGAMQYLSTTHSITDTLTCRYELHENGVLSDFTLWFARDKTYIHVTLDSAGKLLLMRLKDFDGGQYTIDNN